MYKYIKMEDSSHINEEFITVGNIKGKSKAIQEDDTDDDPSVKIVTNQIKIENLMNDLLWELKDYCEELVIPMCDKLTTEHLLEFLHPSLKREF